MNIAIITGGSGPEREISINSAKYISENITFTEQQTFLYPEEYQDFLNISTTFDCVIPEIHGDDGEDGILQKDLEERNIQYIFSNSIVHQKCFHKETAKDIVARLGYSVPETYRYNDLGIKFPIIAKPQSSGSSVGIYILNNQKELDDFSNPNGYLYEQFIQGREFTVGVIEGRDGIHVLPVMEVKKQGFIFNNKEKTTEFSKDIEVFPDHLDVQLQLELEKMATHVHQHLGIKHLSRTDCIVAESGEIYFIEVNTIPGCSKNSFIPKMINKSNLIFSELLEYWCTEDLPLK